MLELFIDFRCTTGSKTPRNIFTKQQRDRWTAANFILDDHAVRADAVAITLGAQMQTWSTSICWLHKHVPSLFPVDIKNKATSIAYIGSSATMKGFLKRPKLVNPNLTVQLLHEFFNTATGSNRTLSRVLNTPPVPIPKHPIELEVPLEQRAKLIRNAGRIYQSHHLVR